MAGLTKRKQMLEVMNKMEDGMIVVGRTRDIWQNNLIWWLCKGMYLVLSWIVKEERNAGNGRV